MVPVRVEKTYPYQAELQDKAIDACIQDPEPLQRPTEMAQDDPRRIQPNIAPIPPEATATLASKQRSRYTQLPSH